MFRVGSFMCGARRVKAHTRARPLAGVHPLHPYENLVFKGGGAKGAIYPGAIRALEEAGIMPYIKRFAGASAGAVTAALLAIGLDAAALHSELQSAAPRAHMTLLGTHPC